MSRVKPGYILGDQDYLAVDAKRCSRSKITSVVRDCAYRRDRMLPKPMERGDFLPR
jgi:hypothetical protein